MFWHWLFWMCETSGFNEFDQKFTKQMIYLFAKPPEKLFSQEYYDSIT